MLFKNVVLLFQLYIAISLLLSATSFLSAKSAIMFVPTIGSRLGDHIKGFRKAFLLAQHHQVPIFYQQDIPYFKQLNLSKYAAKLKSLKSKFHSVRRLKKHASPEVINKQADILYLCDMKISLSSYGVSKKMETDPQAHQNFRTLITPKTGILQHISLPKGKISVALHVRKGGGYDMPLLSRKFNTKIPDTLAKVYADVRWPKKFPPDEYYINQINRIYTLLGEKPLYVYLFTDDKKPTAILERYASIINNRNIHFATRSHNNTHNQNVLTDLFNIARFDCLIRPSSGFSQAAEILGKYKIVISPKEHHWEGTKLIIHSVKVNDQVIEEPGR